MGWEKKLRSVWGLSTDNGSTWKFTFRDSIAFGDLCHLQGQSFIVPVKFPDSAYFDNTIQDFASKSGGCELWKSTDAFASHEVLPQPGVHAFDRLRMFNELHGVAYIIYNTPPGDNKTAAFAETFDGGKTWSTFATARRQGSYQAQAWATGDGSTYVMYESHFTKNGEPNTIYLWRNNGKERVSINVPTDHAHFFPVSADTLLYTVPGELYRMILSPNTSVEESKTEDYETSVFLQSPYPNPASTTVQIPVWYYTATVKPEDVTVTCYDVSGGKVADLSRSIRRVSDGQLIAEWDMSALPSGVYIVKSSSSNRKGNARIVVKAEKE